MSDLPQQQTINQYTADGITLVYNYTYLVPTINDIAVYVTPLGQNANDQADIKILGVDYTVQNAGNINGGTVTFLTAPNGIVTLSRNVQASIDTNYVDPKTIIGLNLDNSFEREMLVIQQNQTKFDNRSLRYEISSLIPDTSGRNIVPVLDPGYIWLGSPSGGVAAALLEENPDCSTLRSELANENQNTDGAGLVGYFDESRLLSTTVRNQLNDYGSKNQGSDGASLIGYYDESASIETTVAQALKSLEENLFSSGSYRDKSVPVPDQGYAYCNGDSYDMVGDSSSEEIKRLGNLYLTTGMTDIYGLGIDSYITTLPQPDRVYHTCVSVGAAGAPNPGTSGFSLLILNVGNPTTQQVVRVFPTAGNSIIPGSYYEIFAPSGRSAVFWFQVDGVGNAPSFPGSLIQMVPILSTDTVEQVAQKILDKSYLQYRVPDWRGLFTRCWDDGAGVDPDSALRTNVNGDVVGDVVGSVQLDALQDHQHLPYGNFAEIGPPQIQCSQNPGAGFKSNTSTAGIDQTGLNGGPAGRVSTETRSINMYLYRMVKF